MQTLTWNYLICQETLPHTCAAHSSGVLLTMVFPQNYHLRVMQLLNFTCSQCEKPPLSEKSHPPTVFQQHCCLSLLKPALSNCKVPLLPPKLPQPLKPPVGRALWPSNFTKSSYRQLPSPNKRKTSPPHSVLWCTQELQGSTAESSEGTGRGLAPGHWGAVGQLGLILHKVTAHFEQQDSVSGHPGGCPAAHLTTGRGRAAPCWTLSCAGTTKGSATML